VGTGSIHSDDEKLVVKDTHHWRFTLLEGECSKNIAVVVVQNSVCTSLITAESITQRSSKHRFFALSCDVNLVSIPKKLLWRESNVEPFPNRRPVIFSELVDTCDELGLEEEERVAGTDADLVCLADVFVGGIGTTSVDLLIQTEVGDLLLLSVVLHWHQVVLLQNSQLLVNKHDEVVKTRHVLNRLDLSSTTETSLELRDTSIVLNLQERNKLNPILVTFFDLLLRDCWSPWLGGRRIPCLG